MHLIILNGTADMDSATFLEKGFGKHLNDSAAPYSLVALREDFIKKFRPIYDDCIKELVRDDETTREFHPPYQGATGYPSLEELLLLPEHHRMEMISTYFVFDILNLYFKENAINPAVKWIIGSLDRVRPQDQDLLIEGLVMPAP